MSSHDATYLANYLSVVNPEDTQLIEACSFIYNAKHGVLILMQNTY